MVMQVLVCKEGQSFLLPFSPLARGQLYRVVRFVHSGISLINTQTLRGPKEKFNLLKVPLIELRLIYKRPGTSNDGRVSERFD